MSPELYKEQFSFAYGAEGEKSEPENKATFKKQIEDFQVSEQLGFEPCGEGEHVFLRISKKDCNTETLARQLAKLAGVRCADVGFSGLKDRWAVTEQWYSVYLGNKSEPDWQSLSSEQIEIQEVTRHQKKLRRGVHKNNDFIIVLRDLAVDQQLMAANLVQLQQGFPNYFGEQRFGWSRANLDKAARLFESNKMKSLRRDKRSIYLSAARSYIFNRILSRRISEKSWDQYLGGEVFSLDGSRSVFQSEAGSDELNSRLESGDIHPSGALWGRGDLASSDCVAELEMQIAGECEVFTKGLEMAGLQQQRRALRVLPDKLTSQWLDEQTMKLSFSLPAGSFATALLRELVVPHQSSGGLRL